LSKRVPAKFTGERLQLLVDVVKVLLQVLLLRKLLVAKLTLDGFHFLVDVTHVTFQEALLDKPLLANLTSKISFLGVSKFVVHLKTKVIFVGFVAQRAGKSVSSFVNIFKVCF
jgi:hypothetical protein